jgi:hypothetical protein
MQVVYRAQNLVDAHLARHLLEDAGIPAFVLGESLLGGAGELPLFGVLRVCVPGGHEAEAAACLEVMSQPVVWDEDEWEGGGVVPVAP